jgi:hypothetical protein
MPDVLIRDVPDEVLAVVESRAAKLGLFRNEFLLRWPVQEAARTTRRATMDDLLSFAGTLSDVADPQVRERSRSADARSQ